MVWFIFVFIIKKWEIVFAIQGTVILFHWFDLVIHKVLNLVLIIKFYTSLLKHYLTRMICIVLLLKTLLGILFIWIEISCPHNHGFMDPIKYKSWQIMVLKKSLFQRQIPMNQGSLTPPLLLFVPVTNTEKSGLSWIS